MCWKSGEETEGTGAIFLFEPLDCFRVEGVPEPAV
jgi:hypothetical protein